MMGPNETAVRKTLAARPSVLLREQPPQVRNCFAGLFNGARQGMLWPDGSLSVGKAECEWDWKNVWERLRELGLVEYRLEELDAPGAISGKMTKFYWSITDKGWLIREDDLAYHRALMDAMDADEAQAAS